MSPKYIKGAIGKGKNEKKKIAKAIFFFLEIGLNDFSFK